MEQKDVSHAEAKTLADKALEKSDAYALHGYFNKKCEDVDALISVMDIIAENGKNKLSERPNDTLVMAMRDISLASIELARAVASQRYDLQKESDNDERISP